MVGHLYSRCALGYHTEDQFGKSGPPLPSVGGWLGLDSDSLALILSMELNN